MTAVTTKDDSLVFEAPGGGSWMLDTTHHGRRPLTRFMQPIYTSVFPPALAAMVERYGLPLAEFRAELVNGCVYIRPMGIGEPESPKGDPPLVLMKVIARLHPKLRQRNRVAAQAWADKRWRQDVDNWFNGGRDQVISANLALQSVDVSSLSDKDLTRHLDALVVHFREQGFQSGATHGGDIVPVGDFMSHCTKWGIAPGQAASLLAGASPSSLETAHMLAPVGAALQKAARTGPGGADAADGQGGAPPPESVEQIRALGDGADAAITEWLRYHGHRIVTSDDIDGQTLIERPDLQLKALLAAKADPQEPVPPAVDSVRDRVPADQRDLFDELLTEARYGLRLRDDNVGVRWNWPAGLIRRAMLEVGYRLASLGRLEHVEHVTELDADEVRSLLTGASGPTAVAVSDRWAFRELVIASDPPLHLGPVGGDPPIAAFPAPLARATGAVLGMIAAMQGEPAAGGLRGVGVGTGPYRGRALVVADAIEALERMEPGDVIVAPFTGPAWNSLLPAVGGLIVEEGGAMCHAAIVAREFALPAIVGATGATDAIPDGADVTIDPTSGTITVH